MSLDELLAARARKTVAISITLILASMLTSAVVSTFLWMPRPDKHENPDPAPPPIETALTPEKQEPQPHLCHLETSVGDF